MSSSSWQYGNQELCSKFKVMFVRTPEVKISLIKLNFEWLCVKTSISVRAYVLAPHSAL
jgi:hypothetical protein